MLRTDLAGLLLRTCVGILMRTDPVLRTGFHFREARFLVRQREDVQRAVSEVDLLQSK